MSVLTIPNQTTAHLYESRELFYLQCWAMCLHLSSQGFTETAAFLQDLLDSRATICHSGHSLKLHTVIEHNNLLLIIKDNYPVWQIPTATTVFVDKGRGLSDQIQGSNNVFFPLPQQQLVPDSLEYGVRHMVKKPKSFSAFPAALISCNGMPPQAMQASPPVVPRLPGLQPAVKIEAALHSR